MSSILLINFLFRIFLFYKPNAYNICMVHERSSVHIYIASCRLLVLLCNFIQQFNLINLGFSPDGSGAEFIFYHIKSCCELCQHSRYNSAMSPNINRTIIMTIEVTHQHHHHICSRL